MSTTTENPAAANIRAAFRNALVEGNTIEGAAVKAACAYAYAIVGGIPYAQLAEAQQADWRLARDFGFMECAKAVREAAEWVEGKAGALRA